MMSSLFDKISTLVNAQVNDVLGKNPKSPLARIKLSAADAEENPRRTGQTLRRRLNEATDYEDELQEKVDFLLQEALALDQQVDALLGAGEEIGARHLQGQLNMKRQQVTIAESELRDHRTLTQHLMQEMSTLDMALDGQERRSKSHAQSSGTRQRIPLDGASGQRSAADKKKPSIIDSVSDKLDEARSGLESLLDNSPVPKPADMAKRYDRFDVVDEVHDPRANEVRKPDQPNMSARLSRLSKPDDDNR